MNLLKHLEIVPDPRKDINKKHNLIDVVFLTLSAVLSGASGWKSIQEFGDLQLEWLREHRKFENGIPRRHCIANIIKALNSELLITALIGWINEKREIKGRTILSIDGKTMRSAWDEDVKKALHVVSAFDVTNGVAIYQEATDRKGKEAQVARQVIDALVLKNTVVTLDALHCEKATMSKIVKKNGDFLIQLKKNRKELYEAVTSTFKVLNEQSHQERHEEKTKAHGREELRIATQIKSNFDKNIKLKWPHIRTLVEIVSERKVKNKISSGSRYYVSSLEGDVEEMARTVRSHWAIENNLHWVLDVVFREDQLKIKDPDGAKHLALFNRVALGIIKQHQGKKDSMAAKRRQAAWSSKYRTELIFEEK